MFGSGKSHKIIHFCARWKNKNKKKKYHTCHSTSINNYLQNTQQNIYFFEWRGNARRALASILCIKMSVCLSRIGARTVHLIAIELSQVVVNIPGMVLEILKNLKIIVLAGVPDGALSLQGHTPFIRLR